MPITRRSWPAVFVLFTAVLAAGCGSSREGAATPASTTTPPTSSTAGSSSSSAPTTTTTITTTTPPAVTAADGGDYSACADGICEVSIPQPGRINFKGGTLQVTSLNADGIDFDLSLKRGGGGTGTLKGTCGTIVRFTSTGGGSGVFCKPDGTPQPGPEPEPGVVALQLVGMTGSGAAVLRVVSA